MKMNTEVLKINKLSRAFLPATYFSKIITKLYKTLMDSLQEPSANHSDSKTIMAWQILFHFIFYLQYTSLYWKQGIQYFGWDYYEPFWRVLSFARLDTIFYILGIEIQAYYTFTGIVFFNFVIFILTVIASSEKRSIPKILKWLFQKALFIQNTLLFIPMLTFFSAIIAKIVNLPSIYPSTSLETISSAHLANCIICLLLHISTSFVYEIMTFEVRHCFAIVDYKAKSSCMIDFKKMISTIVTVELYCFLPVNRLEISHSLNVIVSIWLCILYWIYLPYYNRDMNVIVFATTVCKMFTAFCFAFTYIINSSGFLMLSNIILVPLIILIVPSILDLRYSQIKKIDPKECRNAFYLELQIRKTLIKCEEREVEPLNVFGEYLLNRKDNLDSIALWECSHCIYALQDCKLAMIKLAKIYKTSPSLTTDFQGYKLRKIVKNSKATIPEDLGFFNYMRKIEKIKQVDQDALEKCIILAAEIVGLKPSMRKINALMMKVTEDMEYIVDNYSRLLKEHPKNTECIILLKSLLESIYPDDKIDPDKIYCGEDNSISTQDLAYFDQSNGILLVSGDESNIGIIIYCNDKFGNILGETPSQIIKTNISSYIPYPYNNKHNNFLLNFTRKSTSSLLRFPCTLYFQTEKGFLTECYVKMSCLALDGHIFYLVLAQGIGEAYQRALIDPSGMIFSHTRKFPSLFNYNVPNCQNINLEYIIPGYNIDRHKFKVAVPINVGGKKVFITKVSENIGNASILSVIVVEKEDDLKTAFNKDNIEMSTQIRIGTRERGIRGTREKKFTVMEQFGGKIESEDGIDTKLKKDNDDPLIHFKHLLYPKIQQTTNLNSNDKVDLSETSLNSPHHFKEVYALNTKGTKNDFQPFSISRAISNSYKLIFLMKWLFFIVVFDI